MPRTLIALRPNELEVDDELHVVAEHLPAVGQVHVPAHAELVTVDDGLEVECDAVAAVGTHDRALELTGRLDGLGDGVDRQLTAQLDGSVGADLDVAGVEADLRVALNVEELRRQQMRAKVLVLDVDALGLDGPVSSTPSPWETSLASTSRKVPRKVEISLWVTSKAAEECTVSRPYVPAGILVWVAVVIACLLVWKSVPGRWLFLQLML
jgi:hypothetical protein